jgi:hypothetical protein
VVAGVVVVVVVLIGWLAWSQVSDSGGRGVDSADPVITRINFETDCATLQGEFDRASGNRRVDWMRAADARMRAVGCYR